MKNKLLKITAVLLVFLLCGCSGIKSDSSFSICFIDVGQGDSALVECDGHYMLIDGGDKTAGQKVYEALEEKGIQKLDYLVLSHLHEDHIGGLIKALSYSSSIGRTISNSDYKNTEVFKEFEYQLKINGSKITVPHVGDTYKLGSASVEVIYSSALGDNDSLVLLISYGKTRFLFTGDIDVKTQAKLSENYQNDSDKPYHIDLIKMPHHGAELSYEFLRTFMPDYAIISVGKNIYGHPSEDTLSKLNDADVKTYRTDKNGDIMVESDGKTINITTAH